MKKLIEILAIILIILTTGCDDEYDLEKSILIYDSEYEDLPKYSEWGYNTFGAYYDRKVFISNDYEIPLKIVASGNSTSFIFKGELNNSSSYASEVMALNFNLSNFQPNKYEELTLLNDTNIDLTHSDCSIAITIDNVTLDATVLNGFFEFKKVQNLLVDNEPVEIIVSGTFDFQFLINDEPVSISKGRFDIGLNDDNFYKY